MNSRQVLNRSNVIRDVTTATEDFFFFFFSAKVFR